jgi:hypothetical protein
MSPFERIRGRDEWLVFGWDGGGLAVPNQRGHLIDLASVLRPAETAVPVAWHGYHEGQWPIHCLDSEFRPCADGLAGRGLFVFFASHASPFGLLCEQADVWRFSERRLVAQPIPPALRHPRSPLLGIAVGADERPILLSDVAALDDFLRGI